MSKRIDDAMNSTNATDGAVFALLDLLDAAEQSRPDPADAPSKNSAQRATEARAQFRHARNATAYAWGTLKARRSHVEALTGRLRDAERNLALAQKAEAAEVAAGRLAPPEKRMNVLMRSHVEDVVATCAHEVKRLLALLAVNQVTAATCAESFDVAITQAQMALRGAVRETGIGRDGRPTLQPAEGM
jgi:hypothetical protein